MLTADDLLALNKRVLEYGGGQHGIEHETGLRYAVERPWLAFGDIEMYPTPFDKGAVLMENVICTSPFGGGNKRTGFAAGAALIHVLTGRTVRASANEVVRVSKAVEEKSLDLAALSEWFEAHPRAPQKAVAKPHAYHLPPHRPPLGPVEIYQTVFLGSSVNTGDPLPRVRVSGIGWCS